MANSPGERCVDGFDAHEFGADGISKADNWRDSGYTHYSAYSETGGQISWSEAETDDGERYVADVHMSDRNTGGHSAWS